MTPGVAPRSLFVLQEVPLDSFAEVKKVLQEHVRSTLLFSEISMAWKRPRDQCAGFSGFRGSSLYLGCRIFLGLPIRL